MSACVCACACVRACCVDVRLNVRGTMWRYCSKRMHCWSRYALPAIRDRSRPFLTPAHPPHLLPLWTRRFTQAMNRQVACSTLASVCLECNFLLKRVFSAGLPSAILSKNPFVHVLAARPCLSVPSFPAPIRMTRRRESGLISRQFLSHSPISSYASSSRCEADMIFHEFLDGDDELKFQAMTLNHDIELATKIPLMKTLHENGKASRVRT